MGTVAENLERIRQAVDRAAARAGRDPAGIRILGAAKRQSPRAVREAVEAGLGLVGENYVQEARAKKDEVGPGPEWHLIGRLQTNKAKAAVEVFDGVDTIDRPEIARALDRQAAQRVKPLGVLVEVNLGDECTKSGVGAANLFRLLTEVKGLEWLRCRGLMAIPPFSDDPQASRPHFRRLKELATAARDEGLLAPDARELSMGMSGDYEVAVEEGATIVRIGTLLFGSRSG